MSTSIGTQLLVYETEGGSTRLVAIHADEDEIRQIIRQHLATNGEDSFAKLSVENPNQSPMYLSGDELEHWLSGRDQPAENFLDTLGIRWPRSFSWYFILTAMVVGYFASDHMMFDREHADPVHIWISHLAASFAHNHPGHLAGSMIAFLIAAAIGPRWIAHWPGAMLIVSIGFFVVTCVNLFHPEYTSYLGFSGVSHGLLFMAFLLSSRIPRAYAWLASGLVVWKVIWDLVSPREPAGILVANLEATVMVHSHLYGMLPAIAVCVLLISYRLYCGSDGRRGRP